MEDNQTKQIRLPDPILPQRKVERKKPKEKKTGEKGTYSKRYYKEVLKPKFEMGIKDDSAYWKTYDELTPEQVAHRKKYQGEYDKRMREKSLSYDKRYRRKVTARKSKQLGRVDTCSRCKRELGNTAFDKRNDTGRKKKSRRSYCFWCRKEMNAEYYQRNKEKWKTYNEKT